MSVRISADPNKNWKRNSIQFPRLICELQAAGVFTDELMLELSREMDLSVSEVDEIIERAEKDWESIKRRTK